jgi:hypothetical protein
LVQAALQGWSWRHSLALTWAVLFPHAVGDIIDHPLDGDEDRLGIVHAIVEAQGVEGDVPYLPLGLWRGWLAGI